MNKIQQIFEKYPDDDLIRADGFDDAIIGICTNSQRLVYSVQKCIEILKLEEMSHEEAVEHFYFNVAGADVGKQTPIWVEELEAL
jgi:hypothetical protein